MKLHLSGLPEMTCFLGKKGKTEKKVGDGRVASVGPKGRVRYRKVKGDPEVEQVACPLKLFGVGYRRHPEMVIQIGDGNILAPKKRR